MTDINWDAEEFEPRFVERKAGDKWEGEDEDDDIKDSWDKDLATTTGSTEIEVGNEEGEEEEEEEEGGGGGGGGEGEGGGIKVKVKKKKRLEDILALKEEAKSIAAAEEAKLAAEKAFAQTPQGQAAEKLRLMELEEKNNLELARDMLGISPLSGGTSLEGINSSSSREDYLQFQSALNQKISQLSSSPHFNEFMEIFIKKLCLDLNAPTLKKVKISVEALYSAKLKEEKSVKNKKKLKGGMVKMDLEKDLYEGDGGYDDMDDFM